MKINTATNYLRNKLQDLKISPYVTQKEIEKFVKNNLEFVDVGFTTGYLDWKAEKIAKENK